MGNFSAGSKLPALLHQSPLSVNKPGTTVVKGSPDNSNLLVDLTNGTTFQKNILSVAAYILDLRHQYIIDIVKLSELTKERGFLLEDILSRTYIPSPDCTHLDNIAYLNCSSRFIDR